MVKVIRKIFSILGICVIILLIGYFILRLTHKLEVYRIMTGSMEANIHAGDSVLVIRDDKYGVGDVVTFKKGSVYITHRIIKEDGNFFITKGDANNTEDEQIHKDNIIGKVIWSGGILNLIITYKYAIVGALLSIYLVTWLLADYSKMRKEQREEKEKEKEQGK